jgi:hypothetical protein
MRPVRIVAVVIHYQTPAETRAAVASLAGQVERVVVVDNGSEPPFPEAIRSSHNLGFAGGCNLGIAAAGDCDALLFLNSDAQATAGCVAKMAAELRPGVGIVGARILRDGEIESVGVRFSSRTGRMTLMRSPGACDAVIGCCMLVKSAVLARVGLFAGELFYGFEDLDLCLRAARAGFATTCCTDAVVHHLGARSIGERSPDRLYYAARNHLRVAATAAPVGAAAGAARAAAICGYNLAHALFTSPAPRLAGVRAVLRGIYDHSRRRYGKLSAP